MPIQLGEFEVLVLLAVLRLGDSAYPPAVREAIEQRAKRAVARGAVYVTLDRMTDKGLLVAQAASDVGVAGPPRRSYRVSPKGLRALRRALQAVERMRTGLESLLSES